MNPDDQKPTWLRAHQVVYRWCVLLACTLLSYRLLAYIESQEPLPPPTPPGTHISHTHR